VKPSPSDFRFWEAVQARNVPVWVQAIDSRRDWHHVRYGDARVAAALHEAINARVGWRPSAGLDARNAYSTLQSVQGQIEKHGRALAVKREGVEHATTVRQYVEIMAAEWPHHHGGREGRRTPTYLRFLRRMRKAGAR